MRALRVRLVGLGASLVLVLTGIGGAGVALATHDDNVVVACPVVNVASTGGTNVQSFNIFQWSSTVATGGAVVSGGTNVRCVAVAARN